MARIAFVFTNPGHHHAMMKPAAVILRQRGHDCRLVSLAELRGFRSPPTNGVPVERAIPFAFRRDPNVGESLGTATSARRRLAQQIVWLALAPRLAYLLRDADAVVIPNDVVFPYVQLGARARRRDVPLVLLQEGIRFPLPNERELEAYGTAADVVCCWGPAAEQHFASHGVAHDALRVTGNPRYDELEPSAWQPQGEALLARLGLKTRPVVFLSNPIDDQGFCSPAEKLGLFEEFVSAAVRAELPVVAKLHPREDTSAFRRVAAGRATVLEPEESLFAVLAAARAAVVLASTVGLEALLFRVPLGVLAIPGHGHVFEYVSEGAARPLSTGPDLSRALGELASSQFSDRGTALLDRHLSHRGRAATRVADAVEGAL